SAAAPNRKDLAFLHLELCVKVAACDVTPIEAQLYALDPANAAAFSGSLARAAKANDAARIESVLTSMAAGERFDPSWNPLSAPTAGALTRTNVTDGAPAAVTASEVVAAQALSLQPITNGCSGKALDQPKMLDTCRRLSTVLRHGDTYLTEISGETLAMRVWRKGSPENSDAAEARRVAHYRMSIENQAADRFTGQEGSQRYLQLLATHRTEQEVWLADIHTSGASPNPPPG